MTEAVKALAESLYYDGHWYHIQAPDVKHAVDELMERAASGMMWKDGSSKRNRI